MTEQEQIEVWRKSFEQWALRPPREFNLVRHSNDHRGSWPNQYKVYHVQCAWEAWCEAKRNMPIIELPEHKVLTLALGDTVPLLVKSEVIEVLQSAGIKYKVKGE